MDINISLIEQVILNSIGLLGEYKLSIPLNPFLAICNSHFNFLIDDSPHLLFEPSWKKRCHSANKQENKVFCSIILLAFF